MEYDITKINISEDDILFIQFKKKIPRWQEESLFEYIKKTFPDIKIFIDPDNNIALTILSKE